MGAVGIVVAWAGYSLFIWGFSKVKSAYGTKSALTFSDVVLPSHRSTYVAAATQWAGGTGTTGSSQGPTIIAQAQKTVTDACAKYGAGSSQCQSAKKSLTQLQAIYGGS